jgi:hypothetical protein
VSNGRTLFIFFRRNWLLISQSAGRQRPIGDIRFVHPKTVDIDPVDGLRVIHGFHRRHGTDTFGRECAAHRRLTPTQQDAETLDYIAGSPILGHNVFKNGRRANTRSLRIAAYSYAQS